MLLSMSLFHSCCFSFCLLKNLHLLFFSGCIGTGLCTFSRYKIVDAFLHQFAINGQFYAITQGDWFAGKGVGCCVIKHPRGLIHFFNSHVSKIQT